MDRELGNGESFISIVFTASMLILLSIGVLSILGFLFAMGTGQSTHSPDDQQSIDVEQLIANRTL